MNQLEEFNYTIKSERTKETYKEYIKYFGTWSKSILIELLKLPQKEIQDTLIKYVIHMRDEKLSSSSIKGRVAPIIGFLELNDVSLNKKKIKRYYGEEKKTIKDSAYTTEDIQKMLSIAKLRVKAMILIYSSTGIRRDAILDLRIKHIEKIREYGLYKVTVYENSKEEYTTFTTPECADMIDQYLKHREDSGEIIGKNSPLVRNDYDYFRKDKSKNPQPVTSINQCTLFRHLLVKAGLREAHQKIWKRHETPIFHGFRKFHSSKLVESNLNTECRWLLEGHKLKGNDASYVRISEKQLLQQYMFAVDNLTINEENRLRKKVKTLEVEKSRLDKIEAVVKRMEQELNK